MILLSEGEGDLRNKKKAKQTNNKKKRKVNVTMGRTCVYKRKNSLELDLVQIEVVTENVYKNFLTVMFLHVQLTGMLLSYQ